MTKEQAIKILENEKQCVINAEFCDRDCEKCELLMDSNEILNAYDMAIKELSKNKEHAYWLVTDGYPHRVYCSHCFETNIYNEEICFEKNKYPTHCMWCGDEWSGTIMKIPTSGEIVNYKKHIKAHWVKSEKHGYKCSKCNCMSSLFDDNLKSPYCPWCGAKMEGERE